jgi:hypothetical protein
MNQTHSSIGMEIASPPRLNVEAHAMASVTALPGRFGCLFCQFCIASDEPAL